jgi:hypothetical protein
MPVMSQGTDGAAGRAEMMTKEEANLSAAIKAAQSAPPLDFEVKHRRTNSEARREHGEAMRQRIRIVARSLDLSAEQIKPALSLKHYEIAKLHQTHGVNLLWLIEGKGRMLMSEPPNSNRNPAEERRWCTRYLRRSKGRSRPWSTSCSRSCSHEAPVPNLQEAHRQRLAAHAKRLKR